MLLAGLLHNLHVLVLALDGCVAFRVLLLGERHASCAVVSRMLTLLVLTAVAADGIQSIVRCAAVA